MSQVIAQIITYAEHINVGIFNTKEEALLYLDELLVLGKLKATPKTFSNPYNLNQQPIWNPRTKEVMSCITTDIDVIHYQDPKKIHYIKPSRSPQGTLPRSFRSKTPRM